MINNIPDKAKLVSKALPNNRNYKRGYCPLCDFEYVFVVEGDLVNYAPCPYCKHHLVLREVVEE